MLTPRDPVGKRVVHADDRLQSALELTNALLLCPGVEVGSGDTLGSWWPNWPTRPPSPPRRELAVRSFPEGDVIVDGRSVGRSDGSWLRIPSGERRIEVKAPRGRSGRPVVLQLEEGSQTELLFQFDDT